MQVNLGSLDFAASVLAMVFAQACLDLTARVLKEEPPSLHQLDMLITSWRLQLQEPTVQQDPSEACHHSCSGPTVQQDLPEACHPSCSEPTEHRPGHARVVEGEVRIYVVTGCPAGCECHFGIWLSSWNDLRSSLGFASLAGSGFHLKRFQSIDDAQQYWTAQGKSGTAPCRIPCPR